MPTTEAEDVKRKTLRLSRETAKKLAILAARQEKSENQLAEEILAEALKGVR